jgi:hypothetical protein
VASGFGTVNPFTSFTLTFGTNPRVFTLADLVTQSSVTPGRIVASLFGRPNSTPALDQLGFTFQQQDITDFLGVSIEEEQDLSFGAQEYSVNHVVNFRPVPDFQIDFAAVTNATPVPEPGSLTLLGVAVAGFGVRVWRRRSRATSGL